MIRFTDYAKISNNYCICYFGYAEEYLVQLRLLQPIIEAHFQGLNIFLGCRDECQHILKGCKKILKVSDLKVRKRDFAHVREIRFDGVVHPVEALLHEAEIFHYAVKQPESVKTQKCVICTKGFHPTKPLLKRHVQHLKRIAIDQGYEPQIDTDVDNAGLVMGVECAGLFEAAARGIETRLVPTGVGTRLYKSMFQNAQLLELDA